MTELLVTTGVRTHLFGLEVFSASRGTVLGYNHAIIDHERGDYSESGVRNRGDWGDADPVSMRDCKASHGDG